MITRSLLVLSVSIAVSAAAQVQRNTVTLLIVDLDTRVPILRARVTDAASQPMLAFTDERGQVGIDVVTARRALRVSKPGYVPEAIDVSRSSEQVEVRLARAASIGGRVVDTLGAPVPGLMVLITRANAQAVPRRVSTDDLGEYRVGALAAGTYMVSAETTSGARRGEEIGGIDFVVPARGSCRPPADVRPMFGTPSVFASLAGRVMTLEGRPVPCAEVVAYRGADRVSAATTDSNGGYTLERLRAGTIRVEFRRSGYLTLQWGGTESNQPGRAIAIRDREQVTRIDIRLPRGSSITGTVVDETGEPEEGVTVRALHLRGEDERTIAVGAAVAQTDDRGRYRLFGLFPGRYIVGTAATGEPVELQTGRGYPPAYYPGTVDVATAAAIAVEDSRERQWIDFPRIRTRVATVTGVAVNSRNAPVTDRVILVASQRSGAVIAETHGARVNTSDGRFTISNVAPGDYVLQATSTRGSDQPPEFGRQYVTVTDADPLPLQVQTRAGIDLRGRLVQDGVPPVDPRQFTIMAVPVDWDQTSLLAATETLTVEGDGTLSLPGVTGPRRFVLTSSPFNWHMKTVAVRGRDVTDDVTGFPVSGLGFIRDLEVMVSNRGATIEGDAGDGTAGVADYSVVLFSSNPDHWFGNSRFLKTVRSNTTGKFRIEGVTDGDYYIVATDPLNGSAASAWQQRDFLHSLTSYARRIRVREGEARSISLALTRP